MQLIDAIVRNPVKVAVGILMVALFGVISLGQMPKQLTPEVQIPTITVETRWRGASPQEVEREIIQEQEKFLKSVEGLTKMTSESKDSVGTITLEFLVGTSMDQALLKVNSRLQQVSDYPEDADEPVISTSNSSDRPIAWFILSQLMPGEEELTALGDEHPHLKEMLRGVIHCHNPGLAQMRLKELAQEHPEVQAIMPEEIDVPKLRRFAEDNIQAMFERVPGVSISNVLGGLEDELQVVVDPQKLAARNLTIQDVRRVLRGQNIDTSAGDFWEGKRRWVVRTLGQFTSPEQVEHQLLGIQDGAPVYIRDVAEVRTGYKKPDGLVRRFGTSNIAVNAQRETGANVLDVMEGLQQTMHELNAGVLKQRGLKLNQVYDETEYIYSAIGLVQQNIFIGGALTMIVLMLFLHLSLRTLIVIPAIAVTAVAAAWLSPWYFAVCLLLVVVSGFWFARGALVVGLAIPTSIVGTFLMLGLMGRSLNVISLAGLAFAVGMLVDNAVVVLENIYRRYHEGEPPFTAAVRATQEVWGAVVASTLTTIAVFLPVVFVQEEAGQLFRDIALAISSAVGLSLIISMTLIPTASARLFPKRREEAASGDDSPVSQPEPVAETVNGHGNGKPILGSQKLAGMRKFFDRRGRPRSSWIGRFGRGFVGAIVGTNRWIQRGLIRRLATVALLVGASLGLSYKFWPAVEYLPTGNRNLVIGLILPPPGYNLDELMELGSTVETALRPYWDIDPDSPAAQELDFPVVADFFFVARGRMVFLGVRSADPARVSELEGLVRKVGAGLPGTIVVANQSSLFEQGLGVSRAIDIEITGPDLPTLVGLGGRILGQVGQVLEGTQARPVPSLDLSSPEVHVIPKLVQAAEMGIDAADLGYTVNALIDGAYASDYFIGGDKIDLTIMGEGVYSGRTQDLEALPIATPLGQLVPLGALAEVRLSSGPEQINHRERLRAITIQVSPAADMPLEYAMAKINSEIVEPLVLSDEFPEGYRIVLAGTADKLSKTWEALRFNIVLALLITYLLMAALFESWLYPFVIILSVPLGAVGGILGLQLLNLFVLQTLDVLTMLGFVILIGTVVNNPILIVHQSLNHIREDGMTPREAILESIRTRIRPIFMTTTTTVLGLLPLVIFPGSGSELYRGLGSVVLGGLLFSTVFTLFLVPTVFSLTMDARDLFLRLVWRSDSQEKSSVPTPPREPVAVP
jgi:hydrophobic/amphiphilic exporter-1 (mainly G- bacteria), HAE1 family